MKKKIIKITNLAISHTVGKAKLKKQNTGNHRVLGISTDDRGKIQTVRCSCRNFPFSTHHPVDQRGVIKHAEFMRIK